MRNFNVEAALLEVMKARSVNSELLGTDGSDFTLHWRLGAHLGEALAELECSTLHDERAAIAECIAQWEIQTGIDASGLLTIEATLRVVQRHLEQAAFDAYKGVAA